MTLFKHTEPPKKGVILNDCVDEYYLYEMLHYPRKGLVKKELKAGDEVTIIEKWWNFDGNKFKVEKDGIQMDVQENNIKLRAE